MEKQGKQTDRLKDHTLLSRSTMRARCQRPQKILQGALRIWLRWRDARDIEALHSAVVLHGGLHLTQSHTPAAALHVNLSEPRFDVQLDANTCATTKGCDTGTLFMQPAILLVLLQAGKS